MPDPYALYVGKLAPNKGTAISSTSFGTPNSTGRWSSSVTARPRRARGGRARIRPGRAVHRLAGPGTRPRTWIAHAGMLIFPSRGPESLSRVLLEASALGIPIAAMNTGGTTDIVEDEVTGLLSDNPPELARTCGGSGMASVLRAAARRGAPRSGRLRSSTRAPSSRASKRSTTTSSGSRGCECRPLRVAITARSVFPLHGLGGLERSVYDLARHLARNDVHVTLITPHAARSGRRRRGPPATCSSRSCPTGRSPSLDGVARQCSTGAPPIPSSAAAPARSPPRWSRRGEVDIVHGFGASVLGYARRRRTRCQRPLVLNPQGLEEFGATDPSRARLKRARVSTASTRRHRVRAPGRRRDCHRPRRSSRRSASTWALPTTRSRPSQTRWIWRTWTRWRIRPTASGCARRPA